MASSTAVRVKLIEAERPDQEIVALEDWLRRSRLSGARTQRESLPTRPGQMGPALLPILTVTLASPVLVELLRTLSGWIGSRRRKVTLEIELEGKRVRIESDGNESAETLLRRLEPLLGIQDRQ